MTFPPTANAPVIQGWCPGALRPMRSGDGLVARVRPRLGRLTGAEARAIAALAATHGSGLIDLSARANLQIRGVTPEGHPALITGLASLGLLDADAAREARRNIVLAPFWRAEEPTPRIAAALEAALAAADAPALPGKFGFAVDAGARPILGETAADIRIERAPGGGFLVRADGAGAGARVAEAEAAPAALELARWFLASGGVSGGRGRMRAHLAHGAAPPARFCAGPALAPDPVPARPGPCSGGVLVAFAFGQMNAATLDALAGLGPLRLTPWRMLLIEGIDAPPDLAGLITDPRDPLLRVVACTGAPGCLQAHGETRPLARALAPLVPEGGLLHVSGCAKGCAHPRPAPLTLTAGPAGFDLIRDGAAAAPPLAKGLPPDATRIARLF